MLMLAQGRGAPLILATYTKVPLPILFLTHNLYMFAVNLGLPGRGRLRERGTCDT